MVSRHTASIEWLPISAIVHTQSKHPVRAEIIGKGSKGVKKISSRQCFVSEVIRSSQWNALHDMSDIILNENIQHSLCQY